MDDRASAQNGIDADSEDTVPNGGDTAVGDGAATGGRVDATDGGAATDDVEIVVVAAVAENGVIGRDGAMPWHYPADLRHFKETTLGSPVVMGRRTFESIHDRLGEPLPGRTNVVLTTRDRQFPDGVVRADSIDSAVGAARRTGSESLYVVGGASVYGQFLPLADRLVLTEIHDRVEGDTYFPDVDWAEWTETDREEREELAFVTYERRTGGR